MTIKEHTFSACLKGEMLRKHGTRMQKPTGCQRTACQTVPAFGAFGIKRFDAKPSPSPARLHDVIRTNLGR